MERFTYLLLLVPWALPVILLHWIVGWQELRRARRTLVIGVVVPTLYLAVADGIAVSAGAWHISETLTVGLRWRGLVFEEALFFFLTNVMVVQSLILFLDPEPRARVRRWLQAALGLRDRQSIPDSSLRRGSLEPAESRHSKRDSDAM